MPPETIPSDAVLARFLRAAPVGICVSSLEDGRIREVNDAFLAMSGFTREEVVGKTTVELGFWSDAGSRTRSIHDAFRSGSLRTFERSWRHRSGQLRHGVFSLYSIEQDGEPRLLTFIQDVTERKNAVEVLHQLYASTAAAVGQDFLRSFVVELSRLVGARMVFVARLLPGSTERVRTVVHALDGVIQEDVEYDLAHTPCETVVGKQLCFYPSGVARLFPRDTILTRLGIESYLGTPLYSSTGQTIGLLAVLDTRPIDRGEQATELLRLFAMRVAAELDRMDAEERLRESEERYRSVVEALAEGILVIDRQGAVVAANHSMSRIFGIEMSEVLGDPQRLGLEVFDEGGRQLAPHEQAHHRSLATGEVVSDELLRLRLPGRPDVWTRVNVRPLRRAGEKLPHCVVVSISDVTDSRRMLESLRDSENRYRSVVASLAEGIVVMEASGRFAACNETACRILGLSEEELLGRATTDPRWRTVAEDGSPVPCSEVPLAVSLRTGQALSGVVLGIERADGETRWISMNSQPLLGSEGGSPRGVVVSFSDITERKAAQRKERELELRLLHSQKLEAIGTLAGGIAHDFNNLLAAMLGNAELAQLDIGPGHAAAQSIDEILKACKRARDMVQQILSFSRKQDPHRGPVVLAEVVADTLRLLRPGLPASIELKAEVGAPDRLVLGDDSQLHQVVMNLCTNAVHAMRDSGGCLEVSLVPADVSAELAGRLPGLTPGPHLNLTVRDTGTGMDDAVRSRIFDPFFTTKRTGEGTGLGLAVVHGIVSSHGGAIAVDSAPGRGSRFEVWLPVFEGPSQPARPSLGLPATGRGEHILLVDDEPSLTLLAGSLLERMGYRVTGCNDPREALAAVRLDPGSFDLVLTDFTMPELTGLDLAQAVHAIAPDLPIVLSTGYDQPVDLERTRGSGIRELLGKPYLAADLAAVLERQLGGRRPAG